MGSCKLFGIAEGIFLVFPVSVHFKSVILKEITRQGIGGKDNSVEVYPKARRLYVKAKHKLNKGKNLRYTGSKILRRTFVLYPTCYKILNKKELPSGLMKSILLLNDYGRRKSKYQGRIL